MSTSRKTLMLVTVVVALAAMLGLAACGGSSSSSSAAASSGSASASASSAAASSSAASTSAAASSAAASSASASAESGLTAEDLANVDIEIALDDFDAMSALSSSIQNGQETGKVVKIDGYVNNFAKGMSYSIVERNANKSGSVGTVFEIEGVDEDAYPSDGTHIIITGKVVANDSLSFNIHTLPEFIEVVSD